MIKERAVTLENRRAGARPEMNMQIEGEKVPMHGAGILLTEKKMKKKQKTKNGICFALI